MPSNTVAAHHIAVCNKSNNRRCVITDFVVTKFYCTVYSAGSATIQTRRINAKCRVDEIIDFLRVRRDMSGHEGTDRAGGMTGGQKKLTTNGEGGCYYVQQRTESGTSPPPR